MLTARYTSVQSCGMNGIRFYLVDLIRIAGFSGQLPHLRPEPMQVDDHAGCKLLKGLAQRAVRFYIPAGDKLPPIPKLPDIVPALTFSVLEKREVLNDSNRSNA